mmetsp:Transcript_3509/g.7973  ORF Transcript_3509/g.7973 Transcript_3509/m.7973 type:complete len:99 (-) Transcript_3509:461-757(-)
MREVSHKTTSVSLIYAHMTLQRSCLSTVRQLSPPPPPFNQLTPPFNQLTDIRSPHTMSTCQAMHTAIDDTDDVDDAIGASRGQNTTGYRSGVSILKFW